MENKVRFVKKGNKVVVKQEIPDTELSCKQVLENLASVDAKRQEFEKNIAELKSQIRNFENDIVSYEEAIKTNDERRKDLAKFESWALEYQEKLLKQKVVDLSSEVFELAKKDYVFDEALTKEANEGQLFARYQKFMSIHKEISDNVAQSVINEHLYKTNLLGNPFKGFYADRK